MEKPQIDLAEARRLLELAETKPEKAMLELQSYIGLYHMSSQYDLRDDYERAALYVGRVIYPTHGIAAWPTVIDK